MGKKPFVVLTFSFFTLFPLVLLFSHSFEMLILAFVLRGLKEFGEPTRKALILELAPEHRKAGMFGLYYLVRDLIVSLAAFGGAFLWAIGPEVNLLTAFAFGASGTLWFAWKREGPGSEAVDPISLTAGGRLDLNSWCARESAPSGHRNHQRGAVVSEIAARIAVVALQEPPRRCPISAATWSHPCSPLWISSPSFSLGQ